VPLQGLQELRSRLIRQILVRNIELDDLLTFRRHELDRWWFIALVPGRRCERKWRSRLKFEC